MKRKKTFILITLLLAIVLMINTNLLWTWMYPIAFEQEVAEAAEQYQIDPYIILAVIRAESNFNPNRSSSKGAVGLMQIMPDTAKWIKEHRYGPDAPNLNRLRYPKDNIHLGTWYLAALYKEFHQNWISTLAAYNAGPGNVNKWIKEGWDPKVESIGSIPYGETRHYVQRVLYYAKKYRWIYPDIFKQESRGPS